VVQTTVKLSAPQLPATRGAHHQPGATQLLPHRPPSQSTASKPEGQKQVLPPPHCELGGQKYPPVQLTGSVPQALPPELPPELLPPVLEPPPELAPPEELPTVDAAPEVAAAPELPPALEPAVPPLELAPLEPPAELVARVVPVRPPDDPPKTSPPDEPPAAELEGVPAEPPPSEAPELPQATIPAQASAAARLLKRLITRFEGATLGLAGQRIEL
jgi:hypothetical protein